MLFAQPSNTWPLIERQEISAWREQVAKPFLDAFTGVLAVSGLLVAALGPSTALRWAGIWLVVGAVALFAVGHLMANSKLRTWVFVVAFLVACGAIYYIGGPNPGSALGVAFCLVLAGVILGLRAMRFVLGAFALFLFGLTGVLWLGIWSGPSSPIVFSAELPSVWLRTTLISILIWSGIVLFVRRVVSELEEKIVERERALDQLREEARERRSAEQARQDAEAVALHSQKMEALGQLAAGVAHDFNNALLVVRGWNELARQSDSDDLRASAAQAIEQASIQAEQLARRLLTFGRKDVLRPRYLDTARLIDDTVKTLERILPSSIDLKVSCEPDAVIFADESQIQQLLFNLVINARDAMPEGGSLRLNCRKVLDDTRSENVLIEVEDTGVGMDEETREQVFEPFFTTKQGGKGTGLGLSTVFGIVKQSRGSIDVASSPGKGTRFSVMLPAMEMPAKEKTADPVEKGGAAGGGSVLVVEDDPLAMEFLTFALRRAGYEVEEARDGGQALKIVRRRSLDILCTDSVFPGAALQTVIREFEQLNPEGAVLICSGYVPREVTVEGIESGNYGFLAKPFTAERLLEAMSSLKRNAPS